MKHLSKITTLLFTTALFAAPFLGCHKTASVPAPPKADFTFTTPNAGALPAVVDFSSTSTNANTFEWDFGDGNTANTANANNTYSTAKTYNVKLVVTGDGGKDSITKAVTVSLNKPKASFTFSVADNGNQPSHAVFTNTSTGAARYRWSFDNGDTSSAVNPTDSFFTPKTFNVKLVAINAAGADSITTPVTITINKPTASFTYNILNPYNLPLNIACVNTTQHASTYSWNFGDGDTSSKAAPTHTYTKGGIFTIKLIATNAGGTDSVTQQIRVSPYPVTYKAFDGTVYNLNAWEGRTVMLLMRNSNLNAATMFKWAKVMDSSYGYYYLVTGQFPAEYGPTYINNHVTIADVATTCGAGCGYLGFSGIEMQNTYTDRMYGYALTNQYDQELFYECGRNFWFYGPKLAYLANDLVTTGFAIYMRFMAMDATGVSPAPFNSTPWASFRADLEGLIDTYATNTGYNWANTLGAGAGVSNAIGLGAGDLFASMCIRLRRDYGGEAFVEELWKQAALRPNVVTTQDAVDNFILAACAAANKNLTNLFMTTWRWPMSAAAIAAASKYPG